MRRMLIAAVLSASCFGTATAEERFFNEFVVFGDSLFDSGNGTVVADRSIAIRFTNLDGDQRARVAPQLFAESLGLEAEPAVYGGTNYAVGGFITVDVLESITGQDFPGEAPAPYNPTAVGLDDAYQGFWGGFFTSLEYDRAGYLVENTPSGRTLILLDGGGNDFAQGVAFGEASIGAAAARLITAVAILDDAGADYIMLSNLPDLGLIPSSQAGFLYLPDGSLVQLDEVSTAGLVATLSAGVAGYNGALPLLASFIAPKANIIPVDTAGFIQLLLDNATQFGYAGGEAVVNGRTIDQKYLCYNAVGGACLEHPVYGVNGTSPNPDMLIFHDNLHPTGRTHAIFADYLADIINAPRLIGILPQMGIDAVRSQSNVAGDELRRSRWQSNTGSRWFIAGDWNRAEFDSAGTPDDDRYSASIGATTWVNDNLTVGAMLTLSDQEVDSHGFKVDSYSYGFTALLGYRKENLFVDGTLSLALMDHDDIHRDVRLGNVTYKAKGDTNGHATGMNVLAGYNLISRENWQLAPAIGLQAIHTEVNSFKERGGRISNYDWDDQDYNSVQWRGGLVGSAALDKGVRLFGELFLNKETKDGFKDVEVTNTNLGFGSYKLPGIYIDDDTFVSANLGGSMPMGMGSLNLNYHYSDEGEGSNQVVVSYSSTF